MVVYVWKGSRSTDAFLHVHQIVSHSNMHIHTCPEQKHTQTNTHNSRTLTDYDPSSNKLTWSVNLAEDKSLYVCVLAFLHACISCSMLVCVRMCEIHATIS